MSFAIYPALDGKTVSVGMITDSTTGDSIRTRGFYVSVTGDVVLRNLHQSSFGATSTFLGVPQGTFIPFSTDEVVTGTTATLTAIF